MNYIEKNNSWLQKVASKKETSVTTLTSKIAIATFMNSPCNRMSKALIAVLEGSPKDGRADFHFYGYCHHYTLCSVMWTLSKGILLRPFGPELQHNFVLRLFLFSSDFCILVVLYL